ncbi:uncharacterized protein N7443_002836 [Penicillium atrosanguineum]|uniref:Uncharacterized protein n=1 Tax=Penicillium atrosanguineum TaxID=1132637 RepID=A0A9W9PWQ8_9EURO|nr:uncharacterized protein N7443_002836 [Penicillium atrosanguineum]KAJ5310375.1 hypothetical protein N7443_002836 [Penicillium atrosanguineum]KAJ5315896.1 hypothetical protein N7476_006203 [Penicillium atrosanguineum]
MAHRTDYDAFDHVPQHKSSIHDYHYDPQNFQMPGYLRVPIILYEAMNQLHDRARITITSMKQLSIRRSRRYDNLCSPSLGLLHELHRLSINRLFDWQAQWDPRDPTLSSTPKIPREVLQFTLDPRHYAFFYREYCLWIQNFMIGPIRAWEKLKPLVVIRAQQVLSETGYREWRYWWDSEYMPAMSKWENCLSDLALPSWENIVDELYVMILERVEGAEDFARSICTSCSPPVTLLSQKEEDLEDYLRFV